MPPHPILWSFRRCPYAIRARLAIQQAGLRVELREILLRDKPQAFLDTSPSATVPTLRDGANVLDESLDIMVWALRRNDPIGLLDMPPEGWALIEANDGPFKTALDHTKYAVRYPDLDAGEERARAARHLAALDPMIGDGAWLFGTRPTLADLALLPFVRQFANTDRAWFDAQDWPGLHGWLDRFTEGPAFHAIMVKHPPWFEGQAPLWFGGQGATPPLVAPA